MKYKVDRPRDPANDRFVLSKGYTAPILYAAWAEAGFLKPEDLLNFRKLLHDKLLHNYRDSNPNPNPLAKIVRHGHCIHSIVSMNGS